MLNVLQSNFKGDTMQGKITNYTKQRYITYAIIAALALILPFIRINGNHFFLLSFDHKKLDLLFVSFSTQELFLMPFVLIGLFLTIFFVTTLAGRIWCAWACPQTIFRVIYRDLIQTKLLKIRKNIKDKQKEYPGNMVKKILAILIFYVLSLIATSNLLWYFVPPEDFFLYLQNPAEHLLLLGILFCASLFLTFDVVYIQEKFCVYVCPYARIQSVMFDHDTVQVVYDEKRGGVIFNGKTKLHKKPPQGECIGCEACVTVCPTHIDIRQGMQLDCINCLECADACSVVQNKLNRPSLIQWTSSQAINTGRKVKYFRFRTVAYLVVLAVVFIALLTMTTKKENMLLNINRSTELYNINKKIDGSLEISNSYIFLFQNTDNKPHEYYFEATVNDSNEKLEILRPKKAFKLEAGEQSKQIVVLKANSELAKDDSKDTILHITIKAYANDDKENISVLRESIFVYPKQTIIQEKLGE